VNKQLVRRWIDDGFAAGNLALADELIALDFVNHTPQPGQPPGREGLKQTVSMLHTSFSDLAVSVHDLLAEGDLVAARDEIHGVHVGGAPGRPVTGGGPAPAWRGPADVNKRLIRRFFDEGLSPGDMTVVDELVAPALNLHGAPADLPPGRDGLKALLSVFRAAFPDYRDTLDEMVADDDRVATRWTFRGTHRGHFQGIATTNKPVTIRGMSIFRVTEGQIVEDWTEMDVLGLLQQIGPSPR
jgi:steroid delta-isomerase-like uncharacterized protein